MSTLHPGKKSTRVIALRQAAIKELDAIPAGVTKNVQIKFDKKHQQENGDDFDQDDNGVSRYTGPNSEHIGNGSGGIR